ncbi:MAG: hypothetical protein E7447_04245 [Ruminococcaceae bacterium]|nr:hypothetical protein [Oscillospiraceae bacterium]
MERPMLNHFHNYQEICDYLFAAQKAYPDLMKLKSLAKTGEGRDIWCVTLSKGGDPDSKPAFYVQGGIHAQEGMGITCSLNFLWTVLEQNAQILENVTVYILPCVNPDGSDLCVRSGLSLRSKLQRIDGVDNGIVPQDLDGDGKILFMRRENPNGYYVQLPECGDVLVPRRAGDKGPFYDMFIEGIVENYNGGELKRGYRDLDFNRQYAAGWVNNPNAGDFPGNHTEPSTIMRFLSTHSNIFMMMDVHCGTRALIYSVPGNIQDNRFFRNLAMLGNKITGIEAVAGNRYGKPSDVPPSNSMGTNRDYCNDALGIPTLTVELGNGYNSLGMAATEIFNAPLYERELISKIVAMHAAKGKTVAYPWKKVKHPQLGEVEVGGRDYHDAYFMDADDMLELLPKVADFFLQVVDMVPVLNFTHLTCDAVGEDIYRIRAGIVNNGQLYTRILHGATGYHATRDNIDFKLEGAQEILSRSGAESIKALESLDTAGAEWFIRAKSGDKLTVKATFPKAVNAVAEIIVP